MLLFWPAFCSEVRVMSLIGIARRIMVKKYKLTYLILWLALVFKLPLMAQTTKTLVQTANTKLPGVSKVLVLPTSKKLMTTTKLSSEDPNLLKHQGDDGGQIIVEDEGSVFSGDRSMETNELIHRPPSSTNSANR
jgi:hypothetical protein